MTKYNNLIGKKFGRLTPVEYLGSVGGSKLRCLCDCSNYRTVRASSLLNGHTKSCGCLQKLAAKTANTTHGHCVGYGTSPEYTAWKNMVKRCTVVTYRRYNDYGGRGVTVCDTWLTSFPQFLKDMGLRPSSKHSLERVENSDGYSPENCVWALRRQQDRNKRSNHIVTYRGRTQTVSDWCEELGIKRSVVYNRLNRHKWSPERALETPVESVGHVLTYMGRSQTIAEWCAELNLPRGTVYDRVNVRKWSPERALGTPVKRQA